MQGSAGRQAGNVERVGRQEEHSRQARRQGSASKQVVQVRASSRAG
jgi:hypothetical protein